MVPVAVRRRHRVPRVFAFTRRLSVKAALDSAAAFYVPAECFRSVFVFAYICIRI
jgi:hypothetical protein